MTHSTKFARHRDMMTTMADRNGADLDVAMLAGAILPEEVDEAVQRCAGCAEPVACEGHLEQGAPGIPGYCRNAGMIRSLADLLT